MARPDWLQQSTAANGSGGGTISLAPGCTYALTTPNNGENGLPVVLTQISVFGNGATITGSGAVRIFEVDGPGGNLSLRNVTLTGGSVPDFGGAILNSSGTVTLNQSVVTGNSADNAGGGIASGTFGPRTATLTLNASVVTNNTSPGDGVQPFDGSGNGGGIVNAQGNATLNFVPSIEQFRWWRLRWWHCYRELHGFARPNQPAHAQLQSGK